MTLERKPEAETRKSQLVNSRREIPMSEFLLAGPEGEPDSALASGKLSILEPNCMLKSP
jgi:hypothetical protein